MQEHVGSKETNRKTLSQEGVPDPIRFKPPFSVRFTNI